MKVKKPLCLGRGASSFLLLPKHLSVSFAASSPQGEPPLEGSWHSVSRDGEVKHLKVENEF